LKNPRTYICILGNVTFQDNRNKTPEVLLTSDWESVNIAADFEQVKVQLWVVLLQWTS